MKMSKNNATSKHKAPIRNEECVVCQTTTSDHAAYTRFPTSNESVRAFFTLECNTTNYKLDVIVTGLALCRPGFNPK
jgi:hypothetical protein